MTTSTMIQTILPILSSEAVKAPVSELNLGEIVDIWVALDSLEKAIAARKEELRLVMLKSAELHGTKTERGDFVHSIRDTKITKQVCRSSEPSVEGIRKLCDLKKVPEKDRPIDVIQTTAINVSKLESLIEFGRLKAEDVEPLYKVRSSLRVDPSPLLKEEIKKFSESTAIEVEERPVSEAPTLIKRAASR